MSLPKKQNQSVTKRSIRNQNKRKKANTMRSNEKDEIEINLDDIEFIMQDDFVHFQMLSENCFCSQCKDSITTIVNFKAYLNNLNDLKLIGQCIRCGNKVCRHIETGEKKVMFEAAEHIRLIRKHFKVIQ